MRNHRITKSVRPCSTCRSRSQAPLCLYTLRMISNHSEGTFERLLLLLGGDRPSQTARLTLSPTMIKWCGLESQHSQGSIPPAPPRKLRSRFKGSYLSCTSCAKFQYQATVKLHGSFRPVAGNLHLHRYYDFTESR